MTCVKDQLEAYEALRKAAEEFVARVERGEVRSQRTYRTMKEALAKLPPRVPVLDNRVFVRLGEGGVRQAEANLKTMLSHGLHKAWRES